MFFKEFEEFFIRGEFVRVLVLMIFDHGVSLVIKEEFDEFRECLESRDMETGIEFIILLVEICSLADEFRDDFLFILETGDVQRGVVVVGSLVDFGAVGEEQLDQLEVAFVAGEMERSELVHASKIGCRLHDDST